MNKLKISLQNCYGIKKLEKEFDFSDSTSFAVYAPNGAMKTSFAKTFIDLSEGVASKDLIFPERKTVRDIKDENGQDIDPLEVQVIEPYNENYNSEKVSTLLVNKELKDKYDSIHKTIDIHKDSLLGALVTLSGLRKEIEGELSNTFTSENNKLFIALERVEKEVFDLPEPLFSDISYKEVFNEKVLKFLSTKDFSTKISQYISKYDELIEKSNYFRKGIFNHNNASVVAKSLVDNGFFKASHSISMNGKVATAEIHNQEELEKLIDEEKNTILNNPDLVKAFEEIDNKLKANMELRSFRDYLLKNLKILPELQNIPSFKQKVWISYLKSSEDVYKTFLEEYQKAKAELDNIIKQAKSESTHWLNVIEIFNKRFTVPFQLIVANQDDVILKREIPSINFIFKDSDGEASVARNELLQALSSGEKRALYLLNIIFEIEARREANQNTLFIVDDIADSFDYKNKYAIIEYLKEISEDTGCKQIILTHNFDFFRTIQSRFIRYDYCLMVEKSPEETKIVKADYVNNPFKNNWVKHLDNDKKFIASLPIVRNLIEYTKGDSNDDYKLLTSLLHIKSDTTQIKKWEISEIYNRVFPDLNLTVNDKDKLALDLIFELADACLGDGDGINLENKIVLSMAIRLKGEQIMFSELSDKSEEAGNQTGKLFQRYRNEFQSDSSKIDRIKTLEQVNLMTPENIHFNSFMYEPILDMSDSHLRKLYTDLKNLV
ncbi:MAG TPA: hypothetical protein VGA67_04375 [Candidatus Dojkabacteria bacterium]|jgi:hypothetical protein